MATNKPCIVFTHVSPEIAAQFVDKGGDGEPCAYVVYTPDTASNRDDLCIWLVPGTFGNHDIKPEQAVIVNGSGTRSAATQAAIANEVASNN